MYSGRLGVAIQSWESRPTVSSGSKIFPASPVLAPAASLCILWTEMVFEGPGLHYIQWRWQQRELKEDERLLISLCEEWS